VVAQVPIRAVDMPTPPRSDSKVHVIVTYKATLFIRPPRAAPDIVMEARPEGTSSLVLTLVNRGRAVGLVRRCAVSLQPRRGKAVGLSATALAAVHDQRVLAGGRRRYDLTWPVSLPVQPVKAVGQCMVEP
jgi:hypothetical protein